MTNKTQNCNFEIRNNDHFGVFKTFNSPYLSKNQLANNNLPLNIGRRLKNIVVVLQNHNIVFLVDYRSLEQYYFPFLVFDLVSVRHSDFHFWKLFKYSHLLWGNFQNPTKIVLKSRLSYCTDELDLKEKIQNYKLVKK
jgi:hypothetical protein